MYSIGVIWYQALTGNVSAGRPGGAAWRRRFVDQRLPSSVVDLWRAVSRTILIAVHEMRRTWLERLKALLPPADEAGTFTNSIGMQF